MRRLVGKGRPRSNPRREIAVEDLRYSILIEWSDEDQVYIATLPEFHGCKTHGDTYEEAAKHGREVIESLIEINWEDGRPLPEPATFACNLSKLKS